MTLLYYDPIFLEHKIGKHPESRERLLRVVRHLSFLNLDTECKCPRWQPCSVERLARVHSPDYVQSVMQFAAKGGGFIEEDTAVSSDSYDVALMAAGSVCDAVERVIRGEDRQALCLVRPPGHHALRSSAMGFCLFNNVAVASLMAIDELGIERVLIVDWDVHHGNGTQTTFWENEQVGYYSIHRWPFYPETGSADEVGSGKGRGATLNVPIAIGISRAEYLARFANTLEQFADRIRPQLIVISAGFDGHRADPIGSLGLETEDYGQLTRKVLEVADAHADGKVVSVLEGGYNPDALTDCVEVHLREMLRKETNH